MPISCCHAAASTSLLAVLIQLLLCDAAAAGMKCGGCVGHVKKILESQPGVIQARNTQGSLLDSTSLLWRRSLAPLHVQLLNRVRAQACDSHTDVTKSHLPRAL